jgi:hypothetical protein
MSAYQEYRKDERKAEDLLEDLMVNELIGNRSLPLSLREKFQAAQDRLQTNKEFSQKVRRVQNLAIEKFSTEYDLTTVQIAAVKAIVSHVKRSMSSDMLVQGSLAAVSDRPSVAAKIISAVFRALAAESTDLPEGWALLDQYENEAIAEHEAEKIATEQGEGASVPNATPASEQAAN